MSNRIRLEGVTMTGQYLTVHFTVGERAAKRLEAVKVPWKALIEDERLWSFLNHAEVVKLKAAWGDDDVLPWTP